MCPDFLTSPFDNLLKPIDDHILVHNELLSPLILGNKIKIFSTKDGLPDLDSIDIAIIGVSEYRNSTDFIGDDFSLNEIRKTFYNFYPGNWSTNLADLGNLIIGENVEETYGRLISLFSILFEKRIIPIIIGGSQDLLYANYRAYDGFKNTVNIVNIDPIFDVGDSSKPTNNLSYVSKIILEKPHNLFNYSNLGFQTFLNSQEEIDLMNNLHFESYRLGDLSDKISISEPVLRDADIVAVDLKSIKSSDVSLKQRFSPSGFSEKEICALSRYAGISNRVSSFGVYEYTPSVDNEMTEMLISQMIWYFIEGVNCRVSDCDFTNMDEFSKFNLTVENYELNFYFDKLTSRWWIEILSNESNTKLSEKTLLPCTREDYEQAINGIIPDRWLKKKKKNIL